MTLVLILLILYQCNYSILHPETKIDVINDESPDTIEDTIRKQMSCSSLVCKGRGECILNEFHRPACDCYKQWYQGVNCTALPVFCSTDKTLQLPWMPPCDPLGNYRCYNAFGTYTCLCNPSYTGRTCQEPRPTILG